MLLHIPRILTQDELTHCRRVLDAADWIDGKVTAGDQSAKAKVNLQVPQTSDTGRELGTLVLRALARNDLFTSAALPLRVFPPLFNRYDTGMYFDAHVDNAIRPDPESGFRIRTDVSSTLFLTDPDEYDGGELVIADTYGTHEVKLPAGDLVLYPATSLHSVRRITRGSRWASFFWTQSMVKDDGCRAILHEFDRSIITARQALGDGNPAILGLTATYHNLVRRWSEL
ncbi:Fe2+-dependent dioxygenase [Gluconacetobacter takamatsuzukensis]|uniref:Fe2+-dependent dioxygenase n=1 Tax=Gluconacetobacter takamatsuzukensis TaxID=1286190 RepID=A0A7W4KFB0_9PROT|nr:Fe2+-dependent dioxygenase [Gluconacetobacter takamatsuzukensis]MBB2205848.1 Fe2+-dependent dioxygenase [Gluconacetobacter takamatsuzukensis]